MKAESGAVVAARFCDLLEQQLRALLPNGPDSISMNVTHVYSTGKSILALPEGLTKTDNGKNIKIDLSAGETEYFGFMLGFEADGVTRKTPRIPAEGEAREAANFNILETAIKNTCEALGVDFDNVTYSFGGIY